MESQRKGSKKLWKPPSFEDFNMDSQCKRIKLDESEVAEMREVKSSAAASEPRSVDELATHPKKIEEIKNWFRITEPLKAPILLITGPTGSAKTVTLKLVASSMNISVREWINPVDKNDFRSELATVDKSDFTESRQTDRFDDFIFRASRYKSLFEDNSRTVILIEDFPNIFVWKPKLFHEFLDRYQKIGRSGIIFICTDDQNLNLQNDLFPVSIKVKFNVTEIKFNPVNQSSLMRTLKKASGKELLPSETLQNIAQNSNGDLRNALSNLQIVLSSSRKRGRRKKSPPVSIKDSRTEFYQALGRVLYPKTLQDKKDEVNENRIFLHDVLDIASSFSDSFLALLHENYPSTCGDLRSATDAAKIFSLVDSLRGDDDLKDYRNLIAVIGLMTSNRKPKREGFKPIKKSSAPRLSEENVWSKRFEYSGLLATSRVLSLDFIPYIKRIGRCPTAPGEDQLMTMGSDLEEDFHIENFED